MNIVVLGLPHTQTTLAFNTCAYTMKAWNLCSMLKKRGHEVIHMGVEGSNPPCDRNIPVVPLELWESLYGHPGDQQYNMDSTGKYAVLHELYAKNARQVLLKLGWRPGTGIICAPWGGCQRQAVEGTSQYVVESGIGYHHTWAPYRVFESYAWLHFHMGRENKHEGSNWYDVVIPNSFDPDMFPFSPKSMRKDHFLYMGRLNPDKGIPIAVDVTKRIGAKLILVGQRSGAVDLWENEPHVTILPPADVEARKKLMGEAKAAFVPTQYLEPFGGTAVELQMTGCPVITTDWGVFNETVLHGVTGYRCRTIEQFIWAAKNIDNIDSQDCRQWALENYSTDRVVQMYEEYFQQVLNLRGGGWYQMHPTRDNLSWLQRSYPEGALKKIEKVEKHVAPVIKSVWEEANDWETDWWGQVRNPRWEEEERKQVTYARLIGLPPDLNMGDSKILDVGCGPTSILLRSVHGPSTGLDPLKVSEATLKNYKDHDIEFRNIKAEEFDPLSNFFDEVWMYNCLQHAEDPIKVLLMIARAGKSVRIFEWINMGVCPGHPNNLTEVMFAKIFKQEHWERPIWNTGILHDFGGTLTNNYIAIHARKIGPLKTDINYEK